MGDSDSADQTFHPAESRMRGIRRVWKWGIGFWILAWIYSALVIKLGISFYLGGYEVILGVSSGSFYADFARSPPYGDIQWIRPEFVFSEHRLEQLLDYPEDIFAQLGRTGSPQFGIPGSLAIPMAGVLWLWLLLGWTDGFKKFQWLKSVKSPRMLARILILVGLPLLISFSEYSGRKLQDTFSCMMTTRNIQQAVRGHQGMNNLPNGPLNWNDIFGPKGYLEPKYSNCPSGLPYRLSKNMPGVGELAAECQNPEHMRRLKSNNQIETW
jgi:hypothetical protein